MKILSKYSVYLFALLIVIGAGYFAGKYLSNLSYSPKPESVAEKQKIERQEQLKRQEYALKHADYLAATPSFGPLIKTQEIIVTYNSEAAQKDTATGVLIGDLAKYITIGQNVILYDKDGFTLPLGGKVSSVEKLQEGEEKDSAGDNTKDQQSAELKYKITISLPEGTNTQYLLNELDIITLETTASKRLPLSVLQSDDNGKTYLWLAHKKTKQDTEIEGFSVTKQYIEKGRFDRDYFEEAGNIIEAFDLIVLNPNSKIQPSKEYKIFVTKVTAPLHNPIRQAWIDYELHRLEQDQAELNQIAEDCSNGDNTLQPPKLGDTTLPDGNAVNVNPANSSCSGSEGGATSPVDIFNSFQ